MFRNFIYWSTPNFSYAQKVFLACLARWIFLVFVYFCYFVSSVIDIITLYAHLDSTFLNLPFSFSHFRDNLCCSFLQLLFSASLTVNFIITSLINCFFVFLHLSFNYLLSYLASNSKTFNAFETFRNFLHDSFPLSLPFFRSISPPLNPYISSFLLLHTHGLVSLFSSIKVTKLRLPLICLFHLSYNRLLFS